MLVRNRKQLPRKVLDTGQNMACPVKVRLELEPSSRSIFQHSIPRYHRKMSQSRVAQLRKEVVEEDF